MMADWLSALPDLGAPTADAHAHLDMLEDPASALANAALAGIALVATVVDLTEDERTFTELAGWQADAADRLAARGLLHRLPGQRFDIEPVGIPRHETRVSGVFLSRCDHVQKEIRVTLIRIHAERIDDGQFNLPD